MNRIKKVCGSLILAASLVAGLTAAAPASKAAASNDDLKNLGTLLETVKTATNAVVASVPTETTSSTEISIMSFKIPISLKTTVDPTSKTAKMEGSAEIPDAVSAISIISPKLGSLVDKLGIKAGTKKILDYGDLAKKAVYRHNDNLDRYEVATLPDALAGSSILSSIDATKLEKLAQVLNVSFKGTDEVTLNIKADGDALKAIKSDVTSLVTGLLGDSEYASLLKELSGKDALQGIDINITLKADGTTHVLTQHDIEGTLNVSVSGTPVAIGVNISGKSATTTQTVTIPEEFTKDAQLIAGFEAKAGGVNFISKLSGKNTVFSVSGVANTKATSLTIPKSISKFGKSYSVSAAAKNAFKKATKLKTLTIKNATLKKAVKKNPSKYGLKKGVKIK